MIRKLRFLIALAGLCAACGTAPIEAAAPDEVVTPTEAGLTGSQVWTGNPGVMTTASYNCAGTNYYARQPMYQTSTGGATPSISTMPNGTSPSTIDYSRAEFQIQCNWASMANFPGYAVNTGGDTCSYWTHLPGYWWSWSANVKLIAGSIYYYPPGGFAPVTGYWTVYMQLPWDGTGTAYTPGLDNWGSGYGLAACQNMHTKQIAIY